MSLKDRAKVVQQPVRDQVAGLASVYVRKKKLNLIVPWGKGPENTPFPATYKLSTINIRL